jgi:hypothetical protein
LLRQREMLTLQRQYQPSLALEQRGYRAQGCTAWWGTAYQTHRDLRDGHTQVPHVQGREETGPCVSTGPGTRGELLMGRSNRHNATKELKRQREEGLGNISLFLSLLSV